MPQPSAGKARWAVTSQEVHHELDTNGKPVKMHTIHYQTAPSGVESSITLPSHEYSARNVHDQIHHEANTIEQVHALHSDAIAPPPPPVEAA